MTKSDIWGDREYFKDYMKQKIAISKARISFSDLKNSSNELRKSEKEASYVILTEKTYALVKRYVDLAQIQDRLVKSFDDRILDLLAAQIRLSEFRPIMKSIKCSVSDLHYTPKHIHLLLREITKDYLYAYCYDNKYRNFNVGLYNLIEQAINQFMIKNLKREYEEVIQ